MIIGGCTSWFKQTLCSNQEYDATLWKTSIYPAHDAIHFAYRQQHEVGDEKWDIGYNGNVQWEHAWESVGYIGVSVPYYRLVEMMIKKWGIRRACFVKDILNISMAQG